MIWPLAFVCSWFALWVLFLAVMSLKRAHDEGKIAPGAIAYSFGLVVVYAGYIVDAAVNIGPATLLFFEMPETSGFISAFNLLLDQKFAEAKAEFLDALKNITVTARCGRHINQPGYRGDVARWMCRNLLDPFQLGGHCHKQ